MSNLATLLDEHRSSLSHDPFVRIDWQRGHPVAAAAMGWVGATPARVWSVLTDVEAYAERVPLMNRVRRKGDVIEFRLALKLAFFSVGFSFESSLATVDGRSVTLRYRNGEPKDMLIEYLIEPLPQPDQCALAVHVGFDVDSIGWLARFFLKHQPAIRYGVHPGCALALFDSMRRAV
jgi:hypothetical protein